MEWGAVSAIAAAAAVIVAGWSLRTSRQALKVSLRTEARVQAPLEVYLAEAYIRRIRREDRRICIFRVVITNRSDLANSLRAVDLGILYRKKGSAVLRLTVAHDADLAKSIN